MHCTVENARRKRFQLFVTKVESAHRCPETLARSLTHIKDPTPTTPNLPSLMRFFFSLLLAGALLGTGFTHAQVKKEVSEITEVKRLESESMRSLYDKTYTGSHASFRAEYANHPDEGTTWALMFYGFTKDTTQVSRTNQFLVTADGKQLEPIRLESKTRSVNNSLMEIKRAVFSRSGFDQIATAQNVTITIGSAEFMAVRPRREDMRLILDRVPDQEGPQTASNDSSDSE